MLCWSAAFLGPLIDAKIETRVVTISICIPQVGPKIFKFYLALLKMPKLSLSSVQRQHQTQSNPPTRVSLRPWRGPLGLLENCRPPLSRSFLTPHASLTASLCLSPALSPPVSARLCPRWSRVRYTLEGGPAGGVPYGPRCDLEAPLGYRPRQWMCGMGDARC